MSQGSMGKSRILVNSAAIGEGDSIAAYLVDSAGTLLTSTLVGADQSLDVNVTASVLPTGAATETTLASILSELQALDYADGTAWAAGNLGIEALAVRQDADGAFTGVADGDYSPLQLNSDGKLKVAADVTIDFSFDYAEDAAASSGDVGAFVLGVRRDTAGPQTGTSGDYSELQTNKRGDLRVADRMEASILQQVVSVTTTATALPTSALSGRKWIMVQNLSAGLVYIGSATVTSSGSTRGPIIGAGGSIELNLSDDVTLYGITNASTKDVAIIEGA